MKQTFIIREKTFEVEIFPSKKEGRINGEEFIFEVVPSGILLDGKYLPYSSVRNETGKVTAILMHGKLIPVETNQSEQGQAAAAHKTRGLNLEVRAPLNGQVVQIRSGLQDRVKEGEVLLTLEAMKMENEIVAPISGVIKELSVKKMDVVKAGQLLFTIEEKEIGDSPPGGKSST